MTPPTADSGVRQLAKLKRSIKVLAGDLERIRKIGASALQNAVDKPLFMGTYTTVDNTLQRLREEWDKAIDMCEVYSIDPAFPTGEDDTLLTAALSNYDLCQSYHLQLSPKPAPPLLDLSMNSSSMLQPATKARTILPKIQIKSFSGNWAEWPTFKQLFCSLIKNEPTLSNGERFQYLVSYLDGPALGAIKHIPVTDVNFEQAWNALVRVYDDKRKLASSYLERLLTFKMPAGKPTADSLQLYLSQVSESISSLKNLRIADMEDYLLCELALRVLDPKTRQAFEQANVGTTFPQFETLKEFVQSRYHVLRITDNPSPKFHDVKPAHQIRVPKSPNKFGKKGQALLAHSAKQDGGKAKTKVKPHDSNGSCFICNERHFISSCPQYLAMDPPQRLTALKQFPGCRNCLHPAHRTKECTSTFVCRECEGRHHTTLHLLPKSGSSQTPVATGDSNASKAPGFSGTSVSPEVASVLLGTVVALIPDAHGRLHRFRGLLDAGSQYTMITSKCASKLNMVCKPYQGAISGVNNSPLNNIKGKVQLLFNPNNPCSKLKTEAIVVPTITPPLPQTPLHSSMWEDYRSYQLSDPDFTEPGPISFLIGADLYPEVVTGAPIVIYDEGPRLIETVFGFTVVGRFFGETNHSRAVSLLAYKDTDALIEKFWLLEEPSQPSRSSPEDERCEQHFINTHSRTTEGRYVVSLPFKSDQPNVVPNTNQALTRLYSLEAKLAKDPELREDYIKFMKEYEELGHMSVATVPPKYVIPHHPVYRINGDERKIRVVFDASCRSIGGSLNDHLLTGPKLQADICNIVLNFRRYRYVFTCDIVKMFRQIDVTAVDRCYQQIAWRDDPRKPVTFYQLNTVTYGTRSAPYLAQRVVHQLAHDEGSTYPNAAHALLNNVYVDDIAVGRDSEQELSDLKDELVEILSKGCMELSKWATNLPSLLQNENPASQSVDFCDDEMVSTKILGMKWCPTSDTLSYEVSAPAPGSTKRVILSTIARLYDPLGYLAPAVFYAKCIMQETWKSNLSWDDDVPEDIKTRWEQYTSELHLLSTISIPRCLPKTDTTYQLLCFSDASEKGYCAVAYLRATQDSNVTLSLLKAKTRLAPLKTVTIPRLELCGALLLTELLKSLEPLRSDLGITEVFCFTDSMIVLAWLKTMPHLLQTFVSNRVQQILESTHVEQWHHIKGVQNPADVGSRGALPSALGSHPLWWTGPVWACDPIERWPLSNDTHGVEVPELRTTKLALISVDNCQGFIKYSERHSSWLRLIRVIAYIKRFIANARIPKKYKHRRASGPLSSGEVTAANHHCIKLIQHAYYPDVFITASHDSLPLELRRLAVFVDKHGLIRVGGRLSKAPIPVEQRHPLLLPAKSHFSLLLVRHLHASNHHAGPSILLATLRLNYWMPRARNLVRSVRHRCIICSRFSKGFAAPFMGDLPVSRFAGVRPFLISGVDFAGPFLCRETSRRKAFTHKCYLSIFVCMSSRAYHLELVTALTVEAFLDAFSRFTARRGIPARMMSDCGTNFVGAANYLHELQEWLKTQETQASIADSTTHLGIKWSFNPPAAPHFGGGWEVGVKSVKNLLYKTFGNHAYTQDELSTMFVKIEGVLNSRPLQPISDSPDDPEALTPGHFIIGQPLNTLPEPDLSDVPSNRLSRWQLIRERVQHFWSRWRNEYLSSLQTRNKWLNHPDNLKVGDLVFITDVNTPPSCWPMGRVLEVHPGQDRIVRVVTLKTQKGKLKRPSTKLIPLPTNERGTSS